MISMAPLEHVKEKEREQVDEAVKMYYAEIKLLEAELKSLKDRGPPTKFTLRQKEREEREEELSWERVQNAAF
jgi:hypothetical protein